MTKAAQEHVRASLKEKRQQVANLREELETLNDYLDVLEARARDEGKPKMSHNEVKKRYGTK